jgi:hypothetical protein
MIFAAFKTTTSALTNSGAEHITNVEMDLEMKVRLIIFTGIPFDGDCSKIMPFTERLYSPP